MNFICNLVHFFVTFFITFRESLNELSKTEREFVCNLANESIGFHEEGRCSENTLLVRYMVHTKYGAKRANKFFERLQSLGLETCRLTTSELVSDGNFLDPEILYNLKEFCSMREYATIEELMQNIHQEYYEQ